jgi:hypothetical protein
VSFGEAFTEERQQFRHLLGELSSRIGSDSAAERMRGEGVGARSPSERKVMRPGYSARRVRNISATFSDVWFGNMMPAAPTRIRLVTAAMWAIRISGALQARLSMLWCSDIQYRR